MLRHKKRNAFCFSETGTDNWRLPRNQVAPNMRYYQSGKRRKKSAK